MKRIALFCDGTWNRSDAKNPTSVVRLAQAVMPTAEDGVKQQVFYLPGVGSGQGSTGVARALDKVGGGLFGWGLTANIQNAFRNLVFCYEPGDEIYVFGFSRGAYTARSLTGLIRSTGIPDRSQIGAIPMTLARYRDRDPITHPDTEASLQFRAIMSPDVATSPEEVIWREKQGYGPSELLRINHLGVWDTVGAMGLPGVMGMIARRVNQKYAFHDQKLSSMVQSARHALAIDEQRKHFPPTLWDSKIENMNGAAKGDDRPYQQLWFPGNHGIVGGSGPVPGLSAEATMWIAAGARRAGLIFDPVRLARILERADPFARNARLPQKSGMINLGGMLLAPREGPDHVEDVSTTAQRRVAKLGYAPPTLSKVINKLRANVETQD